MAFGIIPLESRSAWPESLGGEWRLEERGGRSLLGDTVDAVAALVLRRFDLDALLLGGGREIAPHAVGLPGDRLHDLGQGSPLSPSNHRQNFRALALGARRTAFFRTGQFRSFLADLRFLLRRGGIGLTTFGGFPAPRRTLLPGGGLLRGSLLRRDVRALFGNGGGRVSLCTGHI
jgi:hypothetical protein